MFVVNNSIKLSVHLRLFPSLNSIVGFNLQKIHCASILCTLKNPSVEDIPKPPIRPMGAFNLYRQHLKEQGVKISTMKEFAKKWECLTSEEREPFLVQQKEKSSKYHTKQKEYIDSLSEVQKERLEEHRLHKRITFLKKQITLDKMHLYEESSNLPVRARKQSLFSRFIQQRSMHYRKEGKMVTISELAVEWNQMPTKERQSFTQQTPNEDNQLQKPISWLDLYNMHLRSWKKTCKTIFSRQNPCITENAHSLPEYVKELKEYKESLSEEQNINEKEFKLHKRALKLEEAIKSNQFILKLDVLDDPNHERYTTFFSRFFQEQSKLYKEKGKTINIVEAAKLWNKMSTEEKQPYKEHSQAEKEDMSMSKTLKSMKALESCRRHMNEIYLVYRELLALQNVPEILHIAGNGFECFVHHIHFHAGELDKNATKEALESVWKNLTKEEKQNFTSLRHKFNLKRSQMLEYKTLLHQSLQTSKTSKLETPLKI